MTITTTYRAHSMIDGYIVEGQIMNQIIEISKGDRNVRQIGRLVSYIYKVWKAAQRLSRYQELKAGESDRSTNMKERRIV